MKTGILCSCILGLLAPASLCLGQAAVVTDPQLMDQLSTQHSDIIGLLQQQLTKLDASSQSLSTLLTNLGTASKVTVPDADTVSQSISQSGNSMQLSNADLAAKTAAVTGSEVFNETVDGTFKAIGTKVLDKDGNVVGDRDPNRYKTDAVMLSSIQEYYRVRDAAIQRQKQLQAALLDTKTQLDEAVDDASVQKLSAQVEVINGQLADCREQITNANNDVLIREKEIANQTRVESKADGEHLLNKNMKDSIKKLLDPTNFPKAIDMSQGQGLHWGRATATTPPATPPAP